MRKLMLFLLLAPSIAFAQAIVSTGAGGLWNQTTTWVGGVVPISTNSTSISIVGPVSVASLVYNSATPLVIDQATVNTGGTLTISAGAQMNVSNAATDLILAGTGNMQVNGTLVQLAAATITGTTALNTSFNAGSTYEHRNTTWGTLLTAAWNGSSTILVTGLTGSNSAGVSWAQSIGNFTFNCPNLAAGVANLASRFTNIAGDVNIVRTGSTGRLMFSNAAGVLNVAIGGNLNIGDGTQAASLWVTSTGTVTITVAGAVTFASTSATASQNATTGTGIIQINGGDFLVQSGTWNFVSGAGTGTVILNGGNFQASPGTQVNRSGAGNANINFIGAAFNQGIDLDPSLTVSGAINLTVGKISGNVNMQSPITLNSYTQTGGRFVQNGLTLTINGVINQTGGTIDSSSSTSFIVGGAGAISAGLVFAPSPALFDTFTMNRAGVTFSSTSVFRITNLNLTAGTLTNGGSLTIEDQGLISVTAGALTNVPLAAGVYDVSYANAGVLNTSNELPTAPSAILRNFTKSAAGVLTLTKNIEINGDLTLSAGTFANGANSITLDGNYISNGTSTTAVGATFTFTSATATLTGSIAPSFRNLVVNGGFTPSISYGVTANYTVGPSGVVSAGAGTVTFGGTTVITNNGTMNLNAVTIGNTFTMTAPSTTLGIAGNFTTTGTFTNGGAASIILFNGTTALSASEVYANITISGTVTSANIGQTVSGSMINNGSFNIGTGNLTWTGSGSISGTGNTTVADINVSGVSCTYSASGNLTLNDDILGAGFFNSSTSAGTVIFAGAGSAVSGTGAKTFRAVSISATGTFTPAITYTLVGVGGLDVTRTLASGGTIVFGGTTQTITGTSPNIAFNILTTNVGSTLTITPNITINGNLAGAGSITSNGRITFVGLTMSGTGAKIFKDVTVGAGTLNANSNYSISGNLIVTGTLTFSSGAPITTFNGSTTISGAGAATFSFLTITGVLTSSAGTISVVRDFTNNGTFNHGGGTVSFSTAGVVQQQILGTQSIVFNNLIINDVGVATDVTNGIVTAGKTIDIAGTLSFGQTNSVIDADGAGSSVLRIISTSDNPATDGRVAALAFAGSSISGNVTVQRYMSKEGGSNSPSFTNGRIYRYLSSPILNPSVSQLQDNFYVTGTFPGANNGSTPGCTGCTTNPSLFYYDSSVPNFLAFPGGNLLRGVGYAAFVRNDLTPPGGVGSPNNPITVDFTGTINSGAVLISTISSNAAVWNLVGNPYPSPILYTNAGAGTINMAAGIVVKDNGAAGGGALVPPSGGKIAMGQSFWVRANVNGAAQLTFNETDKTTIASTIFYKTGEELTDQMSLKVVRSDGKYDETFIRLSPTSSPTLDTYDIPKKNGVNDLNNDYIDITTVSQDGYSMLLNNLPQVSCGQPIKLNFEDQLENGLIDLTTAAFTLSINTSGSMKSLSWVLHDNFTNTDVDLVTTPSYLVNINNADTSSFKKSRFYLVASSTPIDITKSVSTSSSLCSGSEAIITVSSQNGMTYGAEINGTYYPNLAQGDGSILSVLIDNDKLITGVNTIKIKANSGCDQQFLTTSVIVNKEATYQIASAPNSTILCASGSVTLNATSSQNDAVIKWYETEISATPIATGAQFITPIITDSTAYFVAAVSPSGCEGVRVPVKVAFENISQAISAIPTAPICKGESITLSASSILSGGSFKWYDAMNAITPIGTTSDLAINALQTTKSYFVSYLSAGGCESDRMEVTASVIDFSPTIVAQSSIPTICAGGYHLLTASGASAESTYQWFGTIDGTTLLGEGTQYSTDPLSVTTTYYVSVQNSLGCISPRFAVTANVAAVPAAPNFSAPSYDPICNNGETMIRITNTDPSVAQFRWYTSMTDPMSFHEGLQLKTESLSSNTSYFVSAVNANGCESASRKEVRVNVIQYPEPKIDVSIIGQLKSNFATGNQWYLDNELLAGETNQIHILSGSGVYDLQVTTNQGCTDWAGAVYSTTIVTSIADVSREINVYPNPVSEFLKIYIEGQENVRVNLLDEKGAAVGEMVLRANLIGWEGELDVRTFSKGFYFLRISSENKSVTHKLIIK